MSDERPDQFRATRLIGGTEEASRALAWAGTELVRRQQNPLAGDESRRERWDEVLVIYIDGFDLLHERDRQTVQRLAAEGRREGIMIAIRVSARANDPADWYSQPPAKRVIDLRKNPAYEPYFMDLDEIKALIDKGIQEMDERSKKKGSR